MVESIFDGVARKVLLDNDPIEELKDIAENELGVEIVLGEPDPNLTFDDLFPGWSTEKGKMTELKPCPFCGEMPEWHQDLYDNTFCLYCNNEKCTTDMVATDHYVNKEDAIEAWNTRANPWHTGTPTYSGRYLVSNGYDTSISYFDGKEFIKDFLGFPDVGDIVKWQKIDL